MEEMEIFKSNLIILQLQRNTPSFLISLIFSCIDISVTYNMFLMVSQLITG